MPDQPFESGEDDWVKEMLAQAMLGSGEARSLPIVETAAETPTAESLVPVDEPTESVADLGVVGVPPVELDGEDGRVEEATPEPASGSREIDLPMFDATNDPDVDSMIAASVVVSADQEDDERSSVRGVVEWLVVLGSAVVVALLLRAFLFQAFYIPSASMEETLLINDRVLVNKLSYRLHDINRGDVVVFHRPDADAGEFRDLIKRVIGLPGETIEATDNTIYINGQVLIEPYLTPGEVIADFDSVEIPEGELFMMGDNRDNSGDSRVFGTVAIDRVVGRAFFLFWPLDRVGSL